MDGGRWRRIELSCWVQYIPPSETQNDFPRLRAETTPVWHLLGDFYHSFGGVRSAATSASYRTPAYSSNDRSSGGSSPIWTSRRRADRAPLVPLRDDVRPGGGVYTRRFYLNANLLSTLSGVAPSTGDSPHTTWTLGGVAGRPAFRPRRGRARRGVDLEQSVQRRRDREHLQRHCRVRGRHVHDHQHRHRPGRDARRAALRAAGRRNAPAGQVPVADGTGGTVYAAPTVKAYHNGA